MCVCPCMLGYVAMNFILCDTLGKFLLSCQTSCRRNCWQEIQRGQHCHCCFNVYLSHTWMGQTSKVSTTSFTRHRSVWHESWRNMPKVSHNNEIHCPLPSTHTHLTTNIHTYIHIKFPVGCTSWNQLTLILPVFQIANSRNMFLSWTGNIDIVCLWSHYFQSINAGKHKE